LVAAMALGVGTQNARAQTPAEQPPVPAPQALPAPPLSPLIFQQRERPLDLVVTVTLATGQIETFAREIDRMEIVTLPDGRIEMVHLILVAGGERNTHIWYNYDRIAKLSYRFLTAGGRNRVSLRVIQGSASTRELTDRLEPLSPGEYR
ncbi:MAG: hypothetical protein QGH70_09490, partial [Nitrospinota bacterium]|nr:hypothetical protein [Nitrospinota bacterium]